MLYSISEILAKTTEYFLQKGIENPSLDARLLLSSVLKCKPLDLYLRYDNPILEADLVKFRALIKRRAKREPLQYIIGSVDFFGVKLNCDTRALIPRSETEHLCEIITQDYPDELAELSILDLGTGTGAIALSLANFYKNAKVVAVDKSQQALSLAKENALNLNLSDRVEFIESDWFENVKGEFDIIASNPPYLTQNELDTAQQEVKLYEPHSALVADDNGCADIKNILSKVDEFMSPNARIYFECGLGQAPMFAENKSEKFATQVKTDYSKRDRFLIFWRL